MTVPFHPVPYNLAIGTVGYNLGGSTVGYKGESISCKASALAATRLAFNPRCLVHSPVNCTVETFVEHCYD